MDITNLPDYFQDPDAVLSDEVEWEGGHPPDYAVANALFEIEKSKSHPIGSMEDLISNLMKNWRKEISHKKKLSDCRTMDLTFWFANNGHPPISGKELFQNKVIKSLILGNITQNEGKILSPEMVFPWECLQVYSGPPAVTFKWRHWGQLSGSLTCPCNDEGQRAEGETASFNENIPDNIKPIEIFGVCILHLDEQLVITGLETFWNPQDSLDRDSPRTDGGQGGGQVSGCDT